LQSKNHSLLQILVVLLSDNFLIEPTSNIHYTNIFRIKKSHLFSQDSSKYIHREVSEDENIKLAPDGREICY
jgi:hypothetical protein